VQQAQRTIDGDERVKVLRDRISKYHGDIASLSQSPQSKSALTATDSPISSPVVTASGDRNSMPFSPSELVQEEKSNSVEKQDQQEGGKNFGLLQDLRDKHAQVNVLRSEIAALRAQTNELTAYQFSPGSTSSPVAQHSPPTRIEQAPSTPITAADPDQRKNRLSQLRQRLQEQYGSPPGTLESLRASSLTSPVKLESPQKGEKSFDDLVGVCIRLREELDEQRNALLTEFEAATLGPK